MSAYDVIFGNRVVFHNSTTVPPMPGPHPLNADAVVVSAVDDGIRVGTLVRLLQPYHVQYSDVAFVSVDTLGALVKPEQPYHVFSSHVTFVSADTLGALVKLLQLYHAYASVVTFVNADTLGALVRL